MTYEPPQGYKGTDISLIRQMNSKANSDTINLGLGQLPFNPPEIAVQAMIDAIKGGKTKYTPNAGALDVREAIAQRHYYQRSGKIVSADNVIITQGVEQALFNTISVFANGESKILVPEIGFSVYADIPKYVGGIEVRKYKLDKKTNLPDVSHINELLRTDKRQTLVVFNSPSNPTGQIIPEHIIGRIGRLIDFFPHAYGLSDEVYSELYLTPEQPVTLAKYSDKIITADGISKSAAATGLRVGWSIAPQKIIKEMVKLQQQMICCPPAPNQYFALPVIEGKANDFMEQTRNLLRKNEALVQEALTSTSSMGALPSQGAFYSFIDISQLGTSVDVANQLLEEENVLIIPGKAFGDAGDDFLRLSFAAETEKLEKGLEGLLRFAQRSV